MSSRHFSEPAFFIIGAQKSATTWLWSMLDQHPATSLPEKKEIHYFGSSELFAKGDDWYLSHFDGTDAGKLIGEASTSYFYDRVPFWYNASDKLKHDDSLPTIPALVLQKYPDARFIVVLRDPVYRAISAYFHWMKRGEFTPLIGLEKLSTECPKMRILEYGYYARYLDEWLRLVDPERFRIIIFENQIKERPIQTVKDLYRFLGLNASFETRIPATCGAQVLDLDSNRFQLLCRKAV